MAFTEKSNMENVEKRKKFSNQQEESVKKEMTMEQFRREMGEIKEKEEKGELESVNFAEASGFPALSIDSLTEEDKKIWQAFKDKKLSLEEYRKYRSSINRDDVHRLTFAAFIGNRLGAEMDLEAQAKEYREKQEKEMAEFRKEIAKLQKAEEEGKEKSIHLIEPKLDVSALVKKDKDMWLKLKRGELSSRELKEYVLTIPQEDRNRRQFAAFLCNVLSADILEKQFRERKKEEN